MYLTDKMLRQMIAEIKDEYLTDLPGTEVGSEWDGEMSASEEAMDAFSAELESIEIDASAGVNFMGRSLSFDELIAIVGNYVVSHEHRHAGGAPMKHLRKSLKNAVRGALEDVPQMIADALAEELEDYVEEDSYDLDPPTQDELDDMGGW